MGGFDLRAIWAGWRNALPVMSVGALVLEARGVLPVLASVSAFGAVVVVAVAVGAAAVVAETTGLGLGLAAGASATGVAL